MKMLALTVPLVLVMMALAGCTGGGDGGDDYETPPMDDQGRYVIEMTENFKFIPEKATVPVGATVVWMNEGGRHNVAPVGHSEWTPTAQSAALGEHFSMTFDNAGTFAYQCDPHASLGMKATLKVA